MPPDRPRRRARPDDLPGIEVPDLTAAEAGEPVTRGDVNMVLQGLAAIQPKVREIARESRSNRTAIRVGAVALTVALVAIGLLIHASVGQLSGCESGNRVRAGIVAFLAQTTAASEARVARLPVSERADALAQIRSYQALEAKDFPLRHCTIWAFI